MHGTCRFTDHKCYHVTIIINKHLAHSGLARREITSYSTVVWYTQDHEGLHFSQKNIGQEPASQYLHDIFTVMKPKNVFSAAKMLPVSCYGFLKNYFTQLTD